METLADALCSISDESRPSPARWVLLRGLGRERRLWFDFPRLLSQRLGATAQTIDLAGMGARHAEPVPSSVERMARDVRQRLGEANHEDAWGVLGVSLGAMVAVSLAEQWPGGVSHLVAINGSSCLSMAHERLRPAALGQLLRALTARTPEARERCIYALTTNASAREISGWARQAAELGLDQRVALRAIVRQLVAAARFRPQALSQPALVLSGARDRLVSPSCSAALARVLGAAHQGHPSAGHDLPLEDPDWVVEQIRAWLTSLSG